MLVQVLAGKGEPQPVWVQRFYRARQQYFNDLNVVEMGYDYARSVGSMQ